MADAVIEDDWILREATRADFDELITWFPTQEDVLIWGGPTFRYPFTRETFFEDLCLDRMVSLSLYSPGGDFAGFGQVYERSGRIHFARLVVHPAMRGQGVGKRLVSMLMTAGPTRYDCDEFSLFVLRDNAVAFRCYKALGFVVSEYPEGVEHADVCYYLTRPVQQQEEGEQHDE